MTEQDVDITRLGACHMGPVGTGGPTTADESNNLGNLTIGLLGRDQKVVKYSNPCLLGYLFPTLYPRGQGFYSLDYDGVKRGNIDQIEVYDETMGDNRTYLNDEAEGSEQPRVVAGPTEQPRVVSASMKPVPTTTQLLLCPVCSQPFKPKHSQNVTNNAPRKCKWDSIPGGRIKDDKDRNERIRKSKRLWARKTRLRRKAEEAALGLCMLSQAV
ncbi:hypothetical protein K457DRAFT_16501 [Linnemannia elongata AG-77]|uniref:Uncharacterized protein n=1 Tax=Linnemannia elongata AG-77 TaxID=1314771 RepID=A0A197K5N5_9FUNG|nr:hypothetical protein K457DRAFT_16501 [Linnemannia elongata AG-77]